MPPKKPTKSKTSSPVTRGRSKSAGRSRKSLGRTPSRSRSRSRTTAAARSRTPASESKVPHRRSPSSTSDSSSLSSKEARGALFKHLKPAADASGDRCSRTTAVLRETVPSRFSQRIIQKVETSKVHCTIGECTSIERTQYVSSISPCEKLGGFFRDVVCVSPVTAFVGLLTLLPSVYWLNLLVFSPAVATADSKTTSYTFAGVLWPTDPWIYLDYHCHAFVSLYLLTHFVIARFLPFGYYTGSQVVPKGAPHKLNSLFALALFLGLFSMAEFCKWSFLPTLRPTSLLNKYYLSLLAATGNITIILSLLAYMTPGRVLRSQASAKGKLGRCLVDFWHGRSVRPRWLGLDWKLVLLRPAVVGLLLLESVYLLTQWRHFGHVSPTLATLVAMHFFSVLDFLTFEDTLGHTFEVRYEPLGYLKISQALLLPFVYSIAALYLSSRPDIGQLTATDGSLHVQHTITLVVSVVLFFIGYWIYRSSNNQKALFRRSPGHPSFIGMRTISGPHSQRILAGGWWGVVRHPNYLGDLLMAYSQSLLAGFSSPVLWIYPLLLTCFLLHRIWRTEHMAAEKYGVSMSVYKKFVPCKLIPRIY